MSEEASITNEKAIFIINPIAGTRQKQVIHEAIAKTFREGEYEIYYTEYRGHAFEIASHKAEEGFD